MALLRLVIASLMVFVVSSCGSDSTVPQEEDVERIVRMYIDFLEAGDAEGVESLLPPGVDAAEEIEARLNRFRQRETRSVAIDTAFEFGGQVARAHLVVDFVSGHTYKEDLVLVKGDQTFYVSLGEAPPREGRRAPSSTTRTEKESDRNGL